MSIVVAPMDVVKNEGECHSHWHSMSEAVQVLSDANSPFCNVTWDAILCWPLIPLNRSIRLPCPLPRAFHEQDGYAERHCRQKGRQRNDGRVDLVSWSDYSQCYSLQNEVWSYNRIGQIDETWTHSHTDSEIGLLESATVIQVGASQLEIIGLFISICSICVIMYGLHRSRRLWIPENLARPHVLICILLLAITKVIILFDATATNGPLLNREWCLVWYFLIEFFKTSLHFWFCFRCLAVLCDVIISCVWKKHMKYCPYLFLGWVGPIVAMITWVSRLISTSHTTKNSPRCPDQFYHTSDYWSLFAPQLVTLLVSGILLMTSVIIICRHYGGVKSDVHVSGAVPLLQNGHKEEPDDAFSAVSGLTAFSEPRRNKFQILIELIVLILLALPLTLGMFVYTPSMDNLHVVVNLNYVCTFFSMFQGLFVSLLYGFAQMFISFYGQKNSIVLQKYERLKVAA